MSEPSEDSEDRRDAQATTAALQIQQALTDGTITFGDYPPDEIEQILAALPTADGLDTAE